MSRIAAFLSGCVAAFAFTAVANAELIIFENGDQLRGTIVSLDPKELKLQNTNIGLVTIPRDKIANIVLKENAATSVSTAKNLSNGSAVNDPISQLQNGIDPKVLNQVQDQLLTGATPEARAMFNEMVSGVVSGNINLNDLREQARTTLDELRKVEGDLDEDEAALLGLYSGILEGFIAQGTNSASVKTNQPARPSQKPALKQSPPGKLEFQKPPKKSIDVKE